MKKFIAILCTVGILLSMTACDSQNKDNSSPTFLLTETLEHMKQSATFIGEIEVVKELDKQFSTVVQYDEDLAHIYYERTAKIISAETKDYKKGDLITFFEPDIAPEKDEYSYLQLKNFMNKGDHYYVYLSKSKDMKKLLVIYSEASKVNIQ